MRLAEGRVEALVSRADELERLAADQAPARSFAAALACPTVGVIAEVKRRSPSRGDLNPGLVASELAAAYERGGAAAISVLTEPSHFRGFPADLSDVAATVALPVLRKDFVVHEIQILESRALGASAVLLIARALEPRALARLIAAARAHGIEPLVEVRTRGELARALDGGAHMIGVNARDLETLAVDPNVPLELLAQVPGGIIAIAESGISDRAGVEAVARAGADAVLVGSALSTARDPERSVRGLAGVARVNR